VIPIVLDPKNVRIALVGRGPRAARRLAWLVAGGANQVTVYSDDPFPELDEAAGDALRHRLPDDDDLARVQVLWVVDLDETAAERMAAAARREGLLVNVEDRTRWCDFHQPAVVRRGDLLITVSTGGKSPGLAASIRRRIERLFGPEWAERLREAESNRRARRRDGRPMGEIAAATDALVDRRGWLGEDGR